MTTSKIPTPRATPLGNAMNRGPAREAQTSGLKAAPSSQKRNEQETQNSPVPSGILAGVPANITPRTKSRKNTLIERTGVVPFLEAHVAPDPSPMPLQEAFKSCHSSPSTPIEVNIPL